MTHDRKDLAALAEPPAGFEPPPADPAQRALAEALRLCFGAVRLLMLLLLVIYCFSGLFSVGSNEVALRLRCGDYVGRPGERVLERGTYLAAPFPIEQVITVDTRPQTLSLDREFWYDRSRVDQGKTQAEMRRARSGPLDPTRDGSLLTGDLSIVHARWTVTYRVVDPEQYLANVGDATLAGDLVRCATAEGIVHTAARLTAADLLKAAVDRDAAAAIARQRLATMATGLTIDQLTLEEVAVPASVVGSFEAVTTAETDRSQRVIDAERERSRILGEAAGDASRKLVEMIDAFERASDAGDKAAAESVGRGIDEAIDALQVDGVPIGGQVARLVNAAKTHRSRVVEEVRGDREAFERLLPEYERHSRLVRTRLSEECREEIFTGDVETFYTAPGRLELQFNRDPDVQKQRQQEQMRGPEAKGDGGRGRP